MSIKNIVSSIGGALLAGKVAYEKQKKRKKREAKSVQIEKCIKIIIHPETLNNFIEATCENLMASRKESGNIKFDFYQSMENDFEFLLHEIFRYPSSLEYHKNTPHYNKWKSIANKCQKERMDLSNCTSVLRSEKISYRILCE